MATILLNTRIFLVFLLCLSNLYPLSQISSKYTFLEMKGFYINSLASRSQAFLIFLSLMSNYDRFLTSSRDHNIGSYSNNFFFVFIFLHHYFTGIRNFFLINLKEFFHVIISDTKKRMLLLVNWSLSKYGGFFGNHSKILGSIN